MKLPTTQRESRTTPPPTPPGELVLKIHGGTWHGRIVRLAALRCTLGSGPQCSLRMRLPGLAPLVCELDRTAEPAMIRCWAAGVLLNGQPCQQALLNIGDRLSLGGMDFEILGGIAAALPWAGGFPDQPPQAKKTQQQSETKKSVPQTPRPPQGRMKKHRRRETDLNMTAEELTAPQHKRLSSKLSRPAEFHVTESLPAQFTPPRLPPVSRQQKKSKTPTALREKYLRLREKLRAQQTELEQQTTELTAAQAKLATRHEKLVARRALLESRKTELQATAHKLASETKTLHAQQDQQRTQQAELLYQQEQLHTQQEIQRTQLEELCSAQEALHAEQEQLAQQRVAIERQELAIQTQHQAQLACEAALRTQAEQLCEEQESLGLQQEKLRTEQAEAQAQQTHIEQVRGELDRHDAELRQREERLTQEHERLQSELAELHAELALEQQRLQSRSQQQETELLRAKQELELRANEHVEACEQLAQDQARQGAAKQELAALDAAWQLERAAWDAECQAIRAEHSRISLQLTETETELAQRVAVLAAREAHVQSDQEQLTHELAEVEEERRVLEAATARLACEQMDLEEARGDVRTQAEELETKLAELAAERSHFDAQRAALERLLLDQRDTLAGERADFIRLRDSYLNERSRWQQTKSCTEHDWVQKFTSLEQREAQLQIEGERLRILLATISEQEQQLAASKEDLQQRRHETSLAVRNLEEQQSAWTQQQKDWERREAEFIAEQKRLESCRAAFQTEREKWERQQAAWQDERQKLGRERADIERERKSVQQERSEWDRIRASQLAQASLMAELPSPEEIQQRETSLNQQATELASWRDQLRAQQKEYDTQRAEWQAQLGEAQADLDRINLERAEFQRQANMLQSERERLVELQGELDELRRHLHSQRQDIESRAQDVVARESNLLPREHEIRQAGEQLAQREAQLAMERAGYEIQRVKQQELVKNLAVQRADSERRLLPPGEQLEAFERLQRELEQERQVAGQLRGELESLRQQPAAASADQDNQRVTELEAELALAREELLVQLAANEQERELLASERSQLEEARTELQNLSAAQAVATAAAHDEQSEAPPAEFVQDGNAEIENAVAPQTSVTSEAELAHDELAMVANATEAEQDEAIETNGLKEQPNANEDQIFARLRALTRTGAEEKPAPEKPSSLRASFFKDEAPSAEEPSDFEPSMEETEEAEPVQQQLAVKSYLPTTIEEDEAETPVAPAPVAAKPAPASQASEGEGEDESIDDYMQRLLDRMRGSSEGEGKISNQNQNGKDQHAQDQQKRTEKSLREAADAAPPKPKREYIRTEAPEKKADLAAMRDLANSTARTAVQTSRNKVAAGQALNKLIIGGGGMALCAGALMFLGEEETLFQMLAGTGMILSLLWLAYGLYLSRDMLLAKPMRELVLIPPNVVDSTETETTASEASATTEATSKSEVC